MEELKFSCIAGEWVTQPFGKIVWQVFKNIILKKHWPCASITPGLCIYPSEMKTCSHRKLYINVHSGSVHTYQKLKTTPISFHRWMEKSHPFKGKLLSDKMGQTWKQEHAWSSKVFYWVKKKKPFWKVIVLHD